MSKLVKISKKIKFSDFDEENIPISSKEVIYYAIAELVQQRLQKSKSLWVKYVKLKKQAHNKNRLFYNTNWEVGVYL